MSTLQGQFINDSYRDLLQVSNNNIGIDETSRYIEDGEGTPSILSLSTTRVGVGTTSPAYTLDVAGDINLTGTLKVNGADAVFSNWTVNGADVYRSTGNVGIGVASPARTLHVAGDVNIDTGDAYMWQSGDAALRSSNKDIIFETHNTSPGTLTEKMKISAEGLVRIGGGTPAHILDVQTSWTNTFLARLDNLGGDSSAHGLLVKVARNDINGILLGVHNSDEYKFYVRADGNVGIGTTSPTDLLTLGTADSGTSVISFRTASNARVSEIKAVDTGSGDGQLSLWTRKTGTSYQRITIDSAGNVGIGTSNPGAKLEIAQSDGNNGIRLNYIPSTYPNNYKSDLYHDGLGNLKIESWAGSASIAGDILLAPNGGKVGIGTTEALETFHVSGRTYLQHESNGSVATFTQVRNTSNAGLFGNGAGLGGFQGSLNLWSSNAVAEGEPGGLAGGLADEFVSLDFTSAYASNADLVSGYTAGRVGIIFEGLTQYQPGQPTTQNKSTSMAFGVYNQSSGHVEERMRIRSDGQHVYKATNSSQDDMWTLRRGFYIGANVRRRIRIILSNYEAVYMRVAAQRTNSGDSMVWYHGYFSYNDNERYTNAVSNRVSSGTITMTPASYINGGQAYYDIDFNVSASPARGSIVVESVAGNATVQVTTY
jgi:hypothetical protein